MLPLAIVLLVTTALGLVAVAVSLAVCARLPTDRGPAALFARLLLGMALLACGMHLLLHLGPGRIGAWIALALVLVAVAVRASAVRAGMQQLARHLRRRHTLVLLVLAVLLTVWRSWPVVQLNLLTPFEGTGNHDEIYYTLLADWLLGHSVLAPIPETPRDPLASAAAMSIGPNGLLPRFGAEGIMVLVAALTGLSAAEAFVPVSVLAAVLWWAAGAVFLSALRLPALGLLLAAALLTLNPVVAYTFGNTNLATLFGTAFLGAYFYFLFDALRHRWSGASVVAAGILLGAIAATYNELLTLVVVGTGIMVLLVPSATWLEWALRYGRTLLAIGLTAVASAPAGLYYVAATLRTHRRTIASEHAATSWDQILTGLGWDQIILQVATMHGGFVPALSAPLSAAVALSLLAVVVLAPRATVLRVAGLAAGALVMLAYMVWAGYGYGQFKSIQFLALPLTILVAGSLGTAAARLQVCWLRAPVALLVTGCGLVVLGWNVYVAYWQTAAFQLTARGRHLERDVLALKEARPLLSEGAPIYVSSDLGPAAFMKSRWVPYVMRDLQYVFAPSLLHGGYLHFLDVDYDYRLGAARYVLRKRTRNGGEVPGIVYANPSFEIVDLDASGPIAELGTGFHDDEGGRRWMAQVGTIDVIGATKGGVLRIPVLGRFAGATGQEAIEIEASERRFVAELPAGEGELRIPLAPRARQAIHLAARLMARSPMDAGLGGDPRPLTFSMGDPRFADREPVEYGRGFYADEGGRRWMSQMAVLRLNGMDRGGWLSIPVVGRFGGATGTETLTVRTALRALTFAVTDGRKTVGLELTPDDGPHIELLSGLQASSPIEQGLGSDARALTLCIGRVVYIDRAQPGALLGEGFYQDEGAFRWMAQAAELKVVGQSGGRLRIDVLGRYPRAEGADEIIVTIGRRSQRFPLANGAGVVDVELANSAVQDVRLLAGVRAVSPREAGESGDSRALSYRIGKVQVLGPHAPPAAR